MQDETNVRQDLAGVIEAYEGRTEGELLDELCVLADAERAAGNLDDKLLDEMYHTLAPYLSDVQKHRMELVLDRLRE